MAEVKTIEEICAELESGDYCGQIGSDDQYQVDLLVLLKGLLESEPEPTEPIPVAIFEACTSADDPLSKGFFCKLSDGSYTDSAGEPAVAGTDFFPCPDSPLGFEQGVVEIGCVKDDEGNVTGKVLLCKTSPEDDPTATETRYLLASTDGTITDNYEGSWEPCDSAPCLTLSSKTECYGNGGGDALYVNDDNTTDIAYSNNATTIKFPLTTTPAEPDAIALQDFINQCIADGNSVTIDILDTEGNSSQFIADAVLQGSPNYVYTGIGGPSLSGKVARASATCGDASGSGLACLWTGCESDGTPVTEWRDSLSFEPLTEAQLETIGECDKCCDPCEKEVLFRPACAVDAYTPLGIEVGDAVLIRIERGLCTGVVESVMQFTLGLQAIPDDEQIEVDFDCDTDVEVLGPVEICDANGVRWLSYTLVSDASTGSPSDIVFYDQSGTLGTPAEPFGPCDPGSHRDCVCIIRADGSKEEAWQYTLLTNSGQPFQTYYRDLADRQYLTVDVSQDSIEKDCEPTDKVNCDSERVCYDAGSILECENGTWAVDGEVVDLCGGPGGNPGGIALSGPCADGGIRSAVHSNYSQNGGYCPFPATGGGTGVFPTGDAANIGTSLLNGGQWGYPISLPSTAVIELQVNAGLAGASGSQPGLSFHAETIGGVGGHFGVGVLAWDCATGSTLPVASVGTGSGATSSCSGTMVRPNGTWSQNGPIDFVVDTSGVADVSTVWFATVAFSTNGGATDFISDILIDGEPLSACSIETAEQLATTLTQFDPNGNVWEVDGENVCANIECGSASDYGDISCDASSASPSVEVETECVDVPMTSDKRTHELLEKLPNVVGHRELCALGSPELVDQFVIGDAADAGAGADWVAAIAPLSPVVASAPAPTGTFPIYSGTLAGIGYDVEMVDYVAATAPSSLIRRNLVIENPLSQDGANISDGGFDQTTGSSLSPNAFLISFASPVAAWSAAFVDLESRNDATITLFDATETQLVTDTIDFSPTEGEDDAHAVGFTRAAADVSYILVSVGSSTSDPNVNTNRLAFGRMQLAIPASEDRYIEVSSLDPNGDLTCSVYDADKNLVTDQSILDELTPCSVGDTDKLCEILAQVTAIAENTNPEEDETCYDCEVETCSHRLFVGLSGLQTVISASAAGCEATALNSATAAMSDLAAQLVAKGYTDATAGNIGRDGYQLTWTGDCSESAAISYNTNIGEGEGSYSSEPAGTRVEPSKRRGLDQCTIESLADAIAERIPNAPLEACIDIGGVITEVFVYKDNSGSIVKIEDIAGNVYDDEPVFVKCSCDAEVLIPMTPDPTGPSYETEGDAIGQFATICPTSRGNCTATMLSGSTTEGMSDGLIYETGWQAIRTCFLGFAGETTTIDWGDGSPTVTGTTTQAHEYTTAGTFTVTVTVNSTGACNGTVIATYSIQIV